jgi:CheY-like chemotaxis protein
VTERPLVFIVEDDPDIAEIFSIALKSVGFSVEIIENGARALARLAETAPALVVLDLSMPLVSGDSVLRQFVADKRLLNTRVMVVTAMAAKAEELAEQADVTLIKPVSISQLRDLALRLVPSAGLKPSRPPQQPPPAPKPRSTER